MPEAFICDAVRTPIGRYGGALSGIRPDDLAALTLNALKQRSPSLCGEVIDDIILGCANQAGEDNRNIARMVALLAGLGEHAAGTTLNRLCGSGMDAVIMASRAIKAGEAALMIAGGVESMTRAPFVMPKHDTAFGRKAEMFDTTIGWRLVNPLMQAQFGIDSMPETAENVAQVFGISRQDQDDFAQASQEKTHKSLQSGRFDAEIIAVPLPAKKGEMTFFSRDEHPRLTTPEALAKLKPIVRPNGTITAGNASGVNDGACAIVVASEAAAHLHGLTPRARILGGAVAGCAPRLMGIGPVPATQKLLARLDLSLSDFDVIELNEAFAAQGLAVMRQLNLDKNDPRLNPNGGAIALGHPLGMSGARLIITALHELEIKGLKRALCTMCIGVGQGIAIAIERV